MIYGSSKTYGHDLGLSCCFRQWRAASHCSYLHGYALAVHLDFGANALDDHGWVVDFGALKPVKAWLQETFDHVTLVAADDPELEWFVEADRRGLVQLMIVPAIGCEAFAGMVFGYVTEWLLSVGLSPRVRLMTAEVREHAGNSARVIA